MIAKRTGSEIDTQRASSLAIVDTRQLFFSRNALLDALLFNDRTSQGWLNRATVRDVMVRAGEGVAVVVTAEREGRHEPEQVEFSSLQIAAAMIRYCRAVKIPLPRNAQKSLEAQGEGICFKIVLNLKIAPLHSQT
jgi:hypothetical protein